MHPGEKLGSATLFRAELRDYRENAETALSAAVTSSACNQFFKNKGGDTELIWASSIL